VEDERSLRRYRCWRSRITAEGRGVLHQEADRGRGVCYLRPLLKLKSCPHSVLSVVYCTLHDPGTFIQILMYVRCTTETAKLDARTNGGEKRDNERRTENLTFCTWLYSAGLSVFFM
jgi:hypothetical protein